MSELRRWLEEGRGRGVELAREIGVTPGAVSQWADGQIPAERIFKVSAVTGIPLARLRPDIVINGDAA